MSRVQAAQRHSRPGAAAHCRTLLLVYLPAVPVVEAACSNATVGPVWSRDGAPRGVAELVLRPYLLRIFVHLLSSHGCDFWSSFRVALGHWHGRVQCTCGSLQPRLVTRRCRLSFWPGGGCQLFPLVCSGAMSHPPFCRAQCRREQWGTHGALLAADGGVGAPGAPCPDGACRFDEEWQRKTVGELMSDG